MPPKSPTAAGARGGGGGGGGGVDDDDNQAYAIELDTACHVKELVVKNSRFIGCVGRAATARDAMAFIAAVREDGASHNCWAFRIRGGVSRYSDDGEPSSTAGPPILRALECAGSVGEDCVCVVVRYFGGTKLGTGGLARAYRQAAAAALADAPQRRRLKTTNMVVTVGHSRIGDVLSVVSSFARILDVVYSERGAAISLRVGNSVASDMEAAVQDAAKGQAIIHAP
jgi:putative IMPACT (imprinted ancient) family translation regulator